ncbi:hypothetical protein AURDEDRAFT_128644 [Auricularia subglabra TFB-10046 SS5]|nr:hypothetical protein AURDEDRAFT_128644 [Auricularia subglabra TFB-10046 SS5]
MDALGQPGMFFGATPPPGEASDNRRRTPHVSKACDQCRQRKCKCDGKPEQCYACRIAGMTCTWKGVDKRGGVSAELEILRDKVQVLEDNYAALAAFLNLSGPPGGPQTQGYTQPTITTPEMAYQPLLTPESPTPLSRICGPGAGYFKQSPSSSTANGDFLVVPINVHSPTAQASANSGFVSYVAAGIASSPSADQHYAIPSPNHFTGPMGNPPANDQSRSASWVGFSDPYSCVPVDGAN